MVVFMSAVIVALSVTDSLNELEIGVTEVRPMTEPDSLPQAWVPPPQMFPSILLLLCLLLNSLLARITAIPEPLKLETGDRS